MMRAFGLAVALLMFITPISYGVPSDPDSDTQDTWLFTTQERFQRAAAAIEVNADEETQCILRAHISARDSPSYLTLFIVERDDGAWGWSSSGLSLSPVHGGIGGELYLEDLGGGLSSTFTINTSFTGGFRLTTTGHHLSPPPDAEHRTPLKASSLGFSVECDQPVNVQLHGDRVPRIISSYYSDSGIRLWNHFTGGVNIGAGTGGVYEAPEVRFRSTILGHQAGILEFDHPHGQESWLIDPDTGHPFIRHDGGPGQYEMRATRTETSPWATFFAVLSGFWPIDDLDEIGGLPEPGSVDPL